MISLEQVILLEQKVESAVEKIQQLQAENDALRKKCSELTNALSSKTEQLSSFENDQTKIESGIRKALDRLSYLENSVLKANAALKTATSNTAANVNNAQASFTNNMQTSDTSVSNVQKSVGTGSIQNAPSFQEMKPVQNNQAQQVNTAAPVHTNAAPVSSPAVNPAPAQNSTPVQGSSINNITQESNSSNQDYNQQEFFSASYEESPENYENSEEQNEGFDSNYEPEEENHTDLGFDIF